MKKSKVFLSSFLKKNPLLVFGMGIPSAIIVSQSAKAGIAMGICTFAVLIMTTIICVPFKKILGEKLIFALRVIMVAFFTGVVAIILDGFFPEVSATLGIFVGLIGVNVMMINGGEEEDSFMSALVRAVGQGLSFIIIVAAIGAIREVMGAGTFWGIDIFDGRLTPMIVMSMAPGGLFLLATLGGLVNWMNRGRD